VLSYVSLKVELVPCDALLHEPRQRRSWLIFDVRQKMKFRLAILLATMSLPSTAAERPDYDRTPIVVEAVVVRYGEEHIIAHGKNFEVMIDQKIPAAFLEIRSPKGPYDRRLVVRSDKPLPELHPLRQVGAIVEFTTEKRYLVGLFLDPTKPRDTPSLTVGAVNALKKKEPNKAPEPTPGAVTPRATEGASK
jgi:hypothetical protein